MITNRNEYLVLWPFLKMYGLEKGEICKKIFGKNDNISFNLNVY